MRSRAAALTLSIACTIAMATPRARGQSPPATLGINYAALRTSAPSSAVRRQLYSGFAVELTAPIHGRWGFDGEADFLAPSASAWMQETLLGLRYRAAQGRRWAFYLGARPGFLYASGGFGAAFSAVGPSFNFALDLGGTAELRISRQWLWRIQGGDLLIRGSYGFFPANNLQLSTGLAFHF